MRVGITPPGSLRPHVERRGPVFGHAVRALPFKPRDLVRGNHHAQRKRALEKLERARLAARLPGARRMQPGMQKERGRVVGPLGDGQLLGCLRPLPQLNKSACELIAQPRLLGIALDVLRARFLGRFGTGFRDAVNAPARVLWVEGISGKPVAHKRRRAFFQERLLRP